MNVGSTVFYLGDLELNLCFHFLIKRRLNVSIERLVYRVLGKYMNIKIELGIILLISRPFNMLF